MPGSFHFLCVNISEGHCCYRRGRNKLPGADSRCQYSDCSHAESTFLYQSSCEVSPPLSLKASSLPQLNCCTPNLGFVILRPFRFLYLIPYYICCVTVEIKRKPHHAGRVLKKLSMKKELVHHAQFLCAHPILALNTNHIQTILKLSR